MPGWFRTAPQPAAVASSRPRLPTDRREAGRAYRHWDRLNGRYYFRADLRLEGGAAIRGVVFDGDSATAVLHAGRPMEEQPELLGREITAWVVTHDASCGSRFPVAPAEEQAAFWADQDAE